ncbi:MAG: hypothetical protein ABI397_02150, partial [Candidatus Saccharimonas sp.]
MISINLIPDVKLDMLRSQKVRNFAVSISILTGAVAVAIVIVLSGVIGVQTAAQAAANKKIETEFHKLSSVPGLNDTVTIQNQLSQISALNDTKSLDSRLLRVLEAINPAAPNDMKFSKITLDPIDNTLTIEGFAVGGFASTDVFRKTILHTLIEGKARGSDAIVRQPLTDDVTLHSTSYGANADSIVVLSFKISFIYPEDLFNNSLEQVKVDTPTSKIDVTDS